MSSGWIIYFQNLWEHSKTSFHSNHSPLWPCRTLWIPSCHRQAGWEHWDGCRFVRFFVINYASLGSIQILHDISICVKSGHQSPPKPRILEGFGMGWGSFDSGVDFCWLMIDRSNLASRCLYKHRINKSQVFLVQNDHFQAIRLGFLAKRFFFDRVGWRFRPSKSAKSFQNTWQFNDRPTQWTRHPVLAWLLSVLLMSVMSWWYVYFLCQEAPPFLVAASTMLECLVIQGIQEYRNNQSAKTLVIFCGLCSWSHWIFDFPVTVPRLALHPMVAASCVQLGLNC